MDLALVRRAMSALENNEPKAESEMRFRVPPWLYDRAVADGVISPDDPQWIRDELL